MLDVIHFLLEEDVVTATSEQSKNRTEFRRRVYGDLYDQTYKFGSRSGSSTGDQIGGTGTSIVPRDGRPSAGSQGMVHKPYIPPTDMDIGPDPSRPFKGLDGPLG